MPISESCSIELVAMVGLKSRRSETREKPTIWNSSTSATYIIMQIGDEFGPELGALVTDGCGGAFDQVIHLGIREAGLRALGGIFEEHGERRIALGIVVHGSDDLRSTTFLERLGIIALVFGHFHEFQVDLEADILQLLLDRLQ